MPKTTPVPEEIRLSIIRTKQTHPEWSGRYIAGLFGHHQKTVNRILGKKIPEKKEVIVVEEPVRHEEIRKLLRKVSQIGREQVENR